jgi:regulator of replication initiation timing
MIFPGFEPKRMSDEELMRKISELQGKMVFAAGSGNFDMVEQMQQMLDAMIFEQQERLQIKLHEMRERMLKDVIETEPDLVVKKEVDASTKKKSGKGTIATFFPPKTKKPGGETAHEGGLPPKSNKPS